MNLRTVLLGSLVMTLGACSSPAAGHWQGTADLGPIDAFEIALHFDQEAATGTLRVLVPGAPALTHELCEIHLQGRELTVEYDPAQPQCAGKGPRRKVVATVGEDVVFGELYQVDGEGKHQEKLGFFRAFRRDTFPSTAAAPASSQPAPQPATGPTPASGAH